MKKQITDQISKFTTSYSDGVNDLENTYEIQVYNNSVYVRHYTDGVILNEIVMPLDTFISLYNSINFNSYERLD